MENKTAQILENSNNHSIDKDEKDTNTDNDNDINAIDNNAIDNNNTNKTVSNHSQWILYIIIIGLSGYLITKNSDPINIVFTLGGCIITIFILQKMINRKIYKLEDDDNGVNLIEG